MSTNHEGYEQAMKDVFSVLGAADALIEEQGAMESTYTSALRIALMRLRESNLKSQRAKLEREEAERCKRMSPRSRPCALKTNHPGEHMNIGETWT